MPPTPSELVTTNAASATIRVLSDPATALQDAVRTRLFMSEASLSAVGELYTSDANTGSGRVDQKQLQSRHCSARFSSPMRALAIDTILRLMLRSGDWPATVTITGTDIEYDAAGTHADGTTPAPVIKSITAGKFADIVSYPGGFAGLPMLRSGATAPDNNTPIKIKNATSTQLDVDLLYTSGTTGDAFGAPMTTAAAGDDITLQVGSSLKDGPPDSTEWCDFVFHHSNTADNDFQGAGPFRPSTATIRVAGKGGTRLESEFLGLDYESLGVDDYATSTDMYLNPQGLDFIGSHISHCAFGVVTPLVGSALTSLEIGIDHGAQVTQDVVGPVYGSDVDIYDFTLNANLNIYYQRTRTKVISDLARVGTSNPLDLILSVEGRTYWIAVHNLTQMPHATTSGPKGQKASNSVSAEGADYYPYGTINVSRFVLSGES